MPWVPQAIQAEEWGRLQIVVGNRDVTFFRDTPTQVGEWTSSEPFGDSTLTLTFPQITNFEPLPLGRLDDVTELGHDLAWLAPGKHVELYVLRSDGLKGRLWSGLVASYEDEASETEYALGLQCVGALYQADFGIKQPGFAVASRDIGDVIAETLNEYVSRDYAACRPVKTGILTRKRGGWEPRLTGFVQDLLATATTADSNDSWTVSQKNGWQPVIELKDRLTVHGTLYTGQPGVELALSLDVGATANVIYGEGTDPEGCHWRNTKYPNIRADDAPVYPHAASVTFDPGDGLAGFAVFAEELRQAGYSMRSGDTYSPADADAVKEAQRRAGVLVDGVVGPQTWAAIFQTGSNGGDLSGCYFAPLAWDRRVEPHLHNAAGARIGKNPEYVPSRLRVERFENFGEGVRKRDATISAIAEYHRTQINALSGGWAGRVTLRVDPPEMSRYELRAGMNVLLRNHRGQHRRLHISGASSNWQDGVVTLTVDEKARDLVTLAGMISRNKEAAIDPARRNTTLRRKSRNTQDQFVIFDCESGAGRIPRHAVYGGLWTVLRIPAGQIGDIVKTEYRADTATPFAVGVFGKPVTSNALASLVGNPLRATTGTTKTAWSLESDALIEAGLLEAWGTFDQPMGYYNGAKSDGDPPTGRFLDFASWSYESAVPPWLWVAEYSPVSTFLRGRLYAGVEA